MKQLTGFIPIAALPESTAASAKQQLIETIEWLYKEGAATETNLKLLTAIVESILCSEESYTRFLQCGFDLAGGQNGLECLYCKECSNLW